jgi:hypothetical protein
MAALPPNLLRKYSVEIEIAVYRVELPHNTQQLSHTGYAVACQLEHGEAVHSPRAERLTRV